MSTETYIRIRIRSDRNLGDQLSPTNGNPPPESRSAKVGEDVNTRIKITWLIVNRLIIKKLYC